MAIINLRKHYYPLYAKDTFVEVPDEGISCALRARWGLHSQTPASPPESATCYASVTFRRGQYPLPVGGAFYGNFSLSYSDNPAEQGQIRCGRCRLSKR